MTVDAGRSFDISIFDAHQTIAGRTDANTDQAVITWIGADQAKKSLRRKFFVQVINVTGARRKIKVFGNMLTVEVADVPQSQHPWNIDPADFNTVVRGSIGKDLINTELCDFAADLIILEQTAADQSPHGMGHQIHLKVAFSFGITVAHLIPHRFYQITQASGGFNDARAPTFPRLCLFIIAIDNHTLLRNTPSADIPLQIDVLIAVFFHQPDQGRLEDVVQKGAIM